MELYWYHAMHGTQMVILTKCSHKPLPKKYPIALCGSWKRSPLAIYSAVTMFRLLCILLVFETIGQPEHAGTTEKKPKYFSIKVLNAVVPLGANDCLRAEVTKQISLLFLEIVNQAKPSHPQLRTLDRFLPPVQHRKREQWAPDFALKTYPQAVHFNYNRYQWIPACDAEKIARWHGPAIWKKSCAVHERAWLTSSKLSHCAGSRALTWKSWTRNCAASLDWLLTSAWNSSRSPAQ